MRKWLDSNLVVIMSAMALIVFAAVIAVSIASITQWRSSAADLDKYEVFRDLTFLFVALFAAISTGLWWLLRHTLGETLRQEAEERYKRWTNQQRLNVLRAFASPMVYIGLNFFLDWERGQKTDLSDLKEAINATEWALMEWPHERDIETEREVNKLWAKNNLAYFYAALYEREPDPKLKEKGLQLAKEVYAGYNQSHARFNRPQWVDTFLFAEARFAETRGEKLKVIEAIDKWLPVKALAPFREDLEKSKQYVLGRLEKAS